MTTQDIKDRVIRQGQIAPLSVIACIGNDEISKLIQKYSGSPYSHIEIVYDTLLVGGQPSHVIEGANPGGVILSSMKKLWMEGTDFDVFACPGLTGEQITTGMKFLEDVQYSPYDYLDLGHFYVEKIPLIGNWLADKMVSHSKYICSKVAAVMYQKMGILPANYPVNECKPSDCAKWSFMEKISK